MKYFLIILAIISIQLQAQDKPEIPVTYHEITEKYCQDMTENFDKLEDLDTRYKVANDCKDLYISLLGKQIDAINGGEEKNCNIAEILYHSKKFHKVTIDLLQSQHPDKEYIDYLEDLYEGLLYDTTACVMEEQKEQFVDANVNKYILENTTYQFEFSDQNS